MNGIDMKKLGYFQASTNTEVVAGKSVIRIDGETMYKFFVCGRVKHNPDGSVSLYGTNKGSKSEVSENPVWTDHFLDRFPISIEAEEIESGNIYFSEETGKVMSRKEFGR